MKWLDLKVLLKVKAK